MKVGIQTTSWPTKEFINRLLNGLQKADLDLIVFGTTVQNDAPILGLRVVSYKLFSLFNYSKVWHLVKYTILLSLFKPREKLKLDQIIAASSTKRFQDKAAFYPILWYSPDILHVQWANSAPQFAWVKKFGIKLVVSLRGAHINYSPLTVPGLAESFHKCFPIVDGFHGVSEAICKEALKYGAQKDKCKVIYSGFNLNQFPKAVIHNQFESLPNRSINIISVGRSHWKKGYHFALDATKLLKDRHVAFSYSIIGAAKNEELLFQRNQLGLESEVQFLDKVSFSEVKKFISSADILLLPSVEEGIANVVLEAMLLGTLVITTNCGGMDEVVVHEENGFVVPVRDPLAIVEAILKIVASDPEKLNAIVGNARNTVELQHNEAKMCEGMLDLYKRVAVPN